MKADILKTLEHSNKLIISPDMDGFMTAKLIERFNGSKIVGSYDKNILCLADGINPEECLFVDCDMNRPGYVSIGNHMRLLEDNIAPNSFNPNVHYKVNKYREKFPFATAFLISFATEADTSDEDKIRMAFADSTLRNMEFYSENMRNWSTRMKCPEVSYVMENLESTIDADNEFRKIYVDQAFTSKRFGKTRYLDNLNKALEAEQMAFEPIVQGIKYMSDKVGLNTAIRYNRDIISYAEIFGGEYSVTYDQEVEWK
jgi:hypothetical protein